MRMCSALQRMKQYLCVFAQEHVDFRLQELTAISEILDHQVKFNPEEYSHSSPYLCLEATSDHVVCQLAQRSVLIKHILELWGMGGTYAEVESSFAIKRDQFKRYFGPEVKFRFRMEGFNKKCTLDRQADIIQRMNFLPLEGQVSLKHPDITIKVCEDYGPPANPPLAEPLMVYFGRHITEGQRQLAAQYAVKERHFIANTSMDAQLSLMMANQAKVKAGSLVCDPFVGSGSILIGCAHFGGHVLGADINGVLLHGRGRPSRSGTNQKWRSPDESVSSNLVQYGLHSKYVDVLVADAARTVWRDGELFDAIVTDPPYGVREGPRKTGSRRKEEAAGEGTVSSNPQVSSYSLTDVYQDLLQLAARSLVVGGRLVYWLPVIRHEYDPSLVPQHPCLRVVANSEQRLGGQVSRRLITMEKCSKHFETMATAEGVPSDFRNKYFKFHTRKDPISSSEPVTRNKDTQ